MCSAEKNDTREGEPYGGSIEAQGAVVESEKAHVCSECTFFSFVAADVLTLAVFCGGVHGHNVRKGCDRAGGVQRGSRGQSRG